MTPISIIIFGASGDLTRRKLIPALLHEFQRGRLPEEFFIIGVSRTEYSHDDFRKQMKDSVKEFTGEVDKDSWKDFAPHIYYCAADAAKIEEFDKIQAALQEIEGEGDINRLYYLSVAPV